MSLSSRAVALQGIGFGVALLVAVQGFVPVAVPSSGGGEVSGGGGGGKVTFGKPYPGYDRQGFDPREQLVVDVALELQEADEETIIAMVMAEAVMRYYT